MSFLDLLKIEFMKVKRSKIVPLIFIAPLLVVVSGVASLSNYFTPEYTNAWPAMFIQSALVYAYYLLPFSMIVVCVMIAGRETGNNGILKMLALPVSRCALSIAKFCVLTFYLFMEMVVFLVVFVIAGLIATQTMVVTETLDDIQLALVSVSKKSASVYKSVVILYKSIFRAAMESRIIDHNPTIYLTTKGGGVPQEERQALTDEQAERLLDAIRDLPPYVFVMIGLYAGLRREEILALQWDSEYLDTDTPYLTVRRAWHTEHNRPVISDELKTKAAERNIPLPVCLAECLKAAKETSTSEYVVSNRDGEPLSYTQFKRLWQYIVTRTVKERSYYRYEDGKRVKHTVTPVLGEKAAHNGKVVYSLDFEVTPHQLRHTYITNLIHASVDPKTVQYLAGHESSKITMDIYAKVKYNRPDELVRSMNCAFASWDAAQ